jgi:hypothetical protein
MVRILGSSLITRRVNQVRGLIHVVSTVIIQGIA